MKFTRDRSFWAVPAVEDGIVAGAVFSERGMPGDGRIGAGVLQLAASLCRNGIERAPGAVSVARGESKLKGLVAELFLGKHSSVRINTSVLNGGAFEILHGSAVVITGDLGPSIVCEGGVQLWDSGIFGFDVYPVRDQEFCPLGVYKGAAADRLPSFTWRLSDVHR